MLGQLIIWFDAAVEWVMELAEEASEYPQEMSDAFDKEQDEGHSEE